jgi:hypothetical protein
LTLAPLASSQFTIGTLPRIAANISGVAFCPLASIRTRSRVRWCVCVRACVRACVSACVYPFQ